MKLPSYQWYTGDWRKDAGVQACSIAARGLWREMLDIAHESEPRGELRINGLPMTSEQIGRVAGVAPQECKKLIAELERYGVFSRREDGAIYSRRMVRDEAIRAARAAGGEAGKGHGSKGGAHGIKGGRPRKGRGVFDPPSEPSPSSSTSSSASTNGRAMRADLSNGEGTLDGEADVVERKRATAIADGMYLASVAETQIRLWVERGWLTAEQAQKAGYAA